VSATNALSRLARNSRRREYRPRGTPRTVEEVVDVGRLLACLDRNRAAGGHAPGPDGVRYPDLGRQEAARAFAAVRGAVLARTYAPPPPRPVQVPKKDGTTRTLLLDDLTARALATSALDALLPLVRPALSPIAYAVTGRGGVPALLADLKAAHEAGRGGVLLNLDVRRAFDSVPLAKLMNTVGTYVEDDHLAWLVGRLAGRAAGGVGIPQGLAVSPLLLELYMSEGFDRSWSGAPGVPFLARYVDNLPCLTKDVNEGRDVVKRCRDLLLGLGLSLKDQPEGEYLVDLADGGTTELLGFAVSSEGGSLRYGVPDSSLTMLGDQLLQSHRTANPPRAAKAVVVGWLTAVGPAFDDRRPLVTDRVCSMVRKAGYRELTRDFILSTWASAHSSWESKLLDVHFASP
jgi:hypothetical protein